MTEVEKQILIDCLDRRRKELDVQPPQHPKTLATVISLIDRFKKLDCGGGKTAKANGSSSHPGPKGKEVKPVEIETEVPNANAVKEALKQVDRILDMCEEVGGYDNAAAEDFAQGVADQTEAIADTIEEMNHVTPNQQEALDNMESGISRWIH